MSSACMRAGRGLARVRPRLGPVPGTGIISGSGGDFELHAACEGGGTLVSTPCKRLVDRSLRAAAAQPHASFIRPPRLIFLITLNCCYPASLINHLDYFDNDRKKEEGSTQISETKSFAEVYKTNLKGIYVRSTMSSKFWLASSFDPRTLLGPILRHKCDPHF